MLSKGLELKVLSEAPGAYKSFEQGELLEYRGRFELCACRRATERRWKLLLFTTSTCLNDGGIKILHRIPSIVVPNRLSSYCIDHCRRSPFRIDKPWLEI
ncbi:hypothetical protein E4U50_008413 [Claviceps purpurea]|nr:hypothetical protein E4U50_008413 [Claviceps purpurea]